MSSIYRSPAEAKAASIEKMGADLGALYDALWQELAWVHVKWAEYVQLYSKKESRIDLLNRAAPAFFGIVQEVLWRDVLLHLARLTDKISTAGKSNLTIVRFNTLVSHKWLKEEVGDLINEASVATEFCRDWRNRYLAHTDLDLALGHKAEPLQKASRDHVVAALNSIAAVMNAISRHYTGIPNVFDVDAEPEGSVQLIYVLDDGLRANEQRKQRLNQGLHLDEDTEHRDL